MEALERIINILAWPVTIIISLLILRAPLSELIPTLKKLKYKDLELEFEKEANKILAEAERDLPELSESSTKDSEKVTQAFFSRPTVAPVRQIIESWQDIETRIRILAEHHKIDTGNSIKSLVQSLQDSNLIPQEAAKIILDLSALRNKVAHADEKVITADLAHTFKASVVRVASTLKQV